MDEKKVIQVANKLEVASINETIIPKVKGFENSGLMPIAEMVACISQVDYLNANDFYIPRKEMEDMLAANKEFIASGKAVMLAGHDQRPVEDQDVRDKLIAGIIKEVWLEPDGKVFAKTTIANTDAGKNLVALALAGLGIQASTRLGIVPAKSQEGYDSLIGADSIFYGFDVVLDPAIENTWLEFKAASKDKSKSSTVQQALENSRKYGEELDKELQILKSSKEYAEDFSKAIKRIVK